MATAKIKSDFEHLERDIERKALDKRKIKRLEKQSVEWFLDKVGLRKSRGTNTRAENHSDFDGDEFMRGKKGIKNRFYPGQMFTYNYDPKTKEKLPYYDTFPLVMPIDLYDDGFLGLNIHYIPPYLRSRLLGLIRGTMRSTKLSRESRANITYELIKSTAKFAIAKPAIKRYLSSHIQGKIVRVQPRDWENVIFLPMDNFQKASREKVWRDSVRMMR